MLTLKEISSQLNISTAAVRSLIDKGLLKASNVGAGKNKVYRVTKEDLADFLESRSSKKKSNQTIRKGKRVEVEQFV